MKAIFKILPIVNILEYESMGSETLIYRIANVPLWHICDAQRMAHSELRPLESYGFNAQITGKWRLAKISEARTNSQL
jgi:hypothetical protein